MKALIPAAGFGKRLKPYTLSLPKPLFTIKNTPILDHTIKKIAKAGCSSIEINTHHLADQIKDHIQNNEYSLPVSVVYEKDILETGGAIVNALSSAQDYLLVVNGDIYFDFDLDEMIDHHIKSGNLVTMLLHDYKKYNKIDVENGVIRSFSSDKIDCLAFTGIQVISKEVSEFIPKNKHIGIIDVYKEMIDKGLNINYIKKDGYWIDIGTPENYRTASIDSMIPGKVEIKKVAGDGSDRKWFRAESQKDSLIIADHGISVGTEVKEVESFVKIGKHLFSKGINVPEIYDFDFVSGIVTVEDLGSTHLADFVESSEEPAIIEIYRKVIINLMDLSEKGIEGFDSKVCWQSQSYDRDLIVEKECLYFYNEFLKCYMGLEDINPEIQDEFKLLANTICDNSEQGFIHRDFQSKNIMIKEGEPYFIDFQGGRKGPIEYDLASLLIDPYVNLKMELREDLFSFYLKNTKKDPEKSRMVFSLCRISRNLQILGAYSFLSMKKNKKWFESYIPNALKNLGYNLANCPLEFPVLKSYVEKVSQK